MMKRINLLLILIVQLWYAEAQVRTEHYLEKGWKFTREDNAGFSAVNCDDTSWQTVTIPHDWAIYGPFDRNNDLQKVAIVQDGQETEMAHAGRTGGLPFVGTGWYRLKFEVPEFTKDKKGCLQITEHSGDYLIRFFYNYARIETLVSKNDLNAAVLDASYILSTVKFNDTIIESILKESDLTDTEKVYEVFTSNSEIDNFYRTSEENMKVGE